LVHLDAALAVFGVHAEHCHRFHGRK
jgi:hypothetical protein